MRCVLKCYISFVSICNITQNWKYIKSPFKQNFKNTSLQVLSILIYFLSDGTFLLSFCYFKFYSKWPWLPQSFILSLSPSWSTQAADQAGIILDLVIVSKVVVTCLVEFSRSPGTAQHSNTKYLPTPPNVSSRANGQPHPGTVVKKTMHEKLCLVFIYIHLISQKFQGSLFRSQKCILSISMILK